MEGKGAEEKRKETVRCRGEKEGEGKVQRRKGRRP